MSKLSAFLHPATQHLEQEIIISDRFLDEQGNPAPFKIRALRQDENEALVKLHTIPGKGGAPGKLDQMGYSRGVIVAATIEPDFSSKEMCEAYGTLDPAEVPSRMLMAGEYAQLSNAILQLSGFKENVSAEAKNF